MSYNPIVLNFYESLLRQSDVRLLEGQSWLNDSVISFYFEYLDVIRFNHHPQLLFVSPEVTQCIKVSSPLEISIFLDPLQAKSKSFIFFAVNDNVHAESSGGSHWSLLVFSRPESMLFHFDSCHGSNQQQAMDLGSKIMRYMDLPLLGRFVEADALQQSNGYDCGIHVLCSVEMIAKHVLQCGQVNGCGILDKLKVQKKRRDILELIYALKNS